MIVPKTTLSQRLETVQHLTLEIKKAHIQ